MLLNVTVHSGHQYKCMWYVLPLWLGKMPCLIPGLGDLSYEERLKKLELRPILPAVTSLALLAL